MWSISLVIQYNRPAAASTRLPAAMEEKHWETTVGSFAMRSRRERSRCGVLTVCHHPASTSRNATQLPSNAKGTNRGRGAELSWGDVCNAPNLWEGGRNFGSFPLPCEKSPCPRYLQRVDPAPKSRKQRTIAAVFFAGNAHLGLSPDAWTPSANPHLCKDKEMHPIPGVFCCLSSMEISTCFLRFTPYPSCIAQLGREEFEKCKCLHFLIKICQKCPLVYKKLSWRLKYSSLKYILNKKNKGCVTLWHCHLH